MGTASAYTAFENSSGSYYVMLVGAGMLAATLHNAPAQEIPEKAALEITYGHQNLDASSSGAYQITQSPLAEANINDIAAALSRATVTLEILKNLLSNGSVAKAREWLLAYTPPDTSEGESAQWKRLLSLPTATVGPHGVGAFGPAAAWLRQHAPQFRDMWVAVNQRGELLGQDENRLALRKRLALSENLRGAIFAKL